MQDNTFTNMEAMFTYTDWNQEMTELYNKYSLARGLNHELMKQCPVYAMYALSSYLEEKQHDIEVDLQDVTDEIYVKAGRDPIMFAQAHQQVERVAYEALKPVIEDRMTARMYFVIAMHKSKEEYDSFLAERDEKLAVKTK